MVKRGIYMELEKNTRQYWQMLYNKLEKASEDNTINVSFDSNDIHNGNVTNLRYYIPLALYFKQNFDRKIALNIQLTGKDSTGDRGRIESFFSQSSSFTSTDIMIDKKPIDKNGNVGHIFPLCRVFNTSLKDSDKVDYSKLMNCSYNEETHQNDLDPTMGAYPELANKLLNRLKTDKKRYSGIDNRKFKNEEKKKLRSFLNDYLDMHLKDMGILAQIIWLYILQELLETKQLYSVPQSSNEHPRIYENVLSKSRMDALVYSEGMYQLIENSCLHSHGKVAWFGFRMHSAGRNISMSELQKETNVRLMLYEKYKLCFTKSGQDTDRAVYTNIFNQDTRYFFEFFVMDDASDQIGMTERYNLDHPSSKRIEHLEELFHISVRDDTLENHLDDIIVHYGLRLLRHIVSVNKGYLVGVSPKKEKTLHYYNENRISNDIEGKSYVTEWTAILPINYEWINKSTDSALLNGENCFGTKIEAPRETLYFVSRDKLYQNIKFKSKVEDVERVFTNLKNTIDMENLNKHILDNSVLLIQADIQYAYDLEVFSKALFSLIAYNHMKFEGKMRIAILFENDNLVHEFIRLFSVFYIDGKQSDMQDVQIALCSKNRQYGGIMDVEFILCGISLRNAFINARLFAYHHSENTLQHLPLLDYLTMSDENSNGDIIEANDELFPFDLCLPSQLPDKEQTDLDWKNNVFIERMKRVLNTDIREKNYGCKINDIHIRLSSKLHLNCFYEAELLFHNMGNVSRFAYMIAQDLLYGDSRLQYEQQILLLGYEKFSSSLVMQIEYWLKQSSFFSQVFTAIVYDGEEEGIVRLRPCFDMNIPHEPAGCKIQSVTVLPVGTTLSTIYKMHNTANRYLSDWFKGEWSKETGIQRNFCLILINNDLSSSSMSDITSRYWAAIDRQRKKVVVRTENGSEKEASVNYLIGVNAEWINPQDCKLCNNQVKDIRPIIGAKQSNTIPGAIFTLRERPSGGFHKLIQEKKIYTNWRRIYGLFGNLYYSHIYFGNNHFQFYLLYQNIYLQNKSEIDADLKEYHIDENGFHVVVSPLQMTNSFFVKAVIDNVFKGNARLLRIDLMNAYREEIRSKFSYISEDFRRMRLSNPKAKFSIHFADVSIVTGTRLNRAKLLMKMLLHESGVDYQDVKLFDHIFLLVNRSSFDSINYFSQNPQESLYAYIQLAIPSYNTETDFCPACNLRMKYQLLGKRSTTERLSKEFQRLQEKHEKRTLEEYEELLNNTLLENHSYFERFKLWLYACVPLKTECLLSVVPEADRGGLGIDREVLDNIKESFGLIAGDVKIMLDKKKHQEFLKYLETRNLHLAVAEKGEEIREMILHLMKNHIIAVRDYMRLVTLQRSYEELDEVDPSIPEAKNKYRVTMINLIAEALDENRWTKQCPGSACPGRESCNIRFKIYCQAEWFISYVKVLSRAQIANYYDYRQAIVRIMYDMLHIIDNKDIYQSMLEETHNDDDMKSWRKIVLFLGEIRGFGDLDKEPQLRAQICYQIYMMLLHRLADLQVNTRVNADSVCSIMGFYDEMLDLYFSDSNTINYSQLLELPSYHNHIIRYLKSVKAATMTSNDDVPCLTLAKTPYDLEQMIGNEKPGLGSIAYNELLTARYIFMENTRMLYSGMRDLEELVSTDTFQQIDKYRPADSFGEYMKLLSDEVNKCLTNCYSSSANTEKIDEILYQSTLGNFCRFWHISTNHSPVYNDEEISPLAYILQYFRRLQSLANENRMNWKMDELPYLYEELCRCICGFTGFQMCYIAFCGIGTIPEIFTQSGYYVELMEKDNLLNSSRMDKVIRKAFSGKKDYILIPGVSRFFDDTTQCDYLIMRISLLENDYSDDGLYIVLQSDHHNARRDKMLLKHVDLQKARDVLFMRYRLQEVLTRDYTILINFRFDCSYVRKISKETNPSIMHISDLHVCRDMKEINICNSLEQVLNVPDAYNNSKIKIDLLAISGDIVDSKDANASRMEKNYRYAENLLNKIVITLWKDDCGYLPHDWRRRILITTGNHDYASMNQYQATLKHRSLTSAMPAEGESGTMSNFAYYIDFLIRYLDPPVDELLRNDLNEVRYYHNLNLKVLILNCSSIATARRTNKMGINKEIVKNLLQRVDWNQTTKNRPYRIVVGHYSPEYQLSYFIDNYSVLPGWMWGVSETKPEVRYINDMVNAFQDAVKERMETIIKPSSELSECLEYETKFCKEFEALEGAMNSAVKEATGTSDLLADKYFVWLKWAAGIGEKGGDKKQYVNFINRIKDNDLYKKIKEYYLWIKKSKQEYPNESISQLLFEINESILMGENDKKDFGEFIKNMKDINIIGEIDTENNNEKSYDLYLSGHIHAYSENLENNIFVADKLLDKGRDDIRGYIISNLHLNDLKSSYRWMRFGGIINEK